MKRYEKIKNGYYVENEDGRIVLEYDRIYEAKKYAIELSKKIKYAFYTVRIKNKEWEEFHITYWQGKEIGE